MHALWMPQRSKMPPATCGIGAIADELLRLAVLREQKSAKQMLVGTGCTSKVAKW
jgi:hypothetical protein